MLSAELSDESEGSDGAEGGGLTHGKMVSHSVDTCTRGKMYCVGEFIKRL